MEYVGNMSLVTVWVSVTGCGGYITVGFWLTTSGFIALLLEQMQEQTGLTLKAGWLVGCFGLKLVGWLVGLGFNGLLRQYFSLYRAVSQRKGERGKKG